MSSETSARTSIETSVQTSIETSVQMSIQTSVQTSGQTSIETRIKTTIGTAVLKIAITAPTATASPVQRERIARRKDYFLQTLSISRHGLAAPSALSIDDRSL